jgi:ABC-type Fe3+-hydroxamate transport system substrate-binding protein
MRRALPYLFLCAAALGIGCARSFTYVKLAPKSSISSIVSLSPSTTEIVASNANVQILKGRTASDNYPTYALTNIPVVASVKPDYEKITAMAPDLIVYDASLYDASDTEKIKALGFMTFVIDAPTIKDFENQLFAFADLTGNQTNVSDYVDRIDVSLANASPKPSPSPRVAVIMPGDGGAPLIAGTKTFTDDVFKEVGGTPVGPDVDHFVPLNAETLVALNPDLIVVPSSKGTAAHDEQSIAADPRFKSTNAVKNGRIATMDEDVVLRRGARVDHFIEGAYKVLVGAGNH